MSGLVIYLKRITRPLVFGDNVAKRGYGGQAKAMRGEPNAVGVPTKWNPDTNNDSYFSDDDFKEIKPLIDEAFKKLKLLKAQGYDIVIPADGLGTGLAELPKRAPLIHDYIKRKISGLGRG
jgi:hypothetical protein